MRMPIVFQSLIVLASLILPTESIHAGQKITVVTTAEFPPIVSRDIDADVIFIDALDRLNKNVSLSIPAHIGDVSQRANAWLNSPGGQVYLDALRPATEQLIRSWQWGIEWIPAVVIEASAQRFVVYGTADVSKALAQWSRWESDHAE